MNAVAISFGNITIYWYSIFILVAFILGYLLVYLEIKRHKEISNKFLVDYFFYLVPIVIVGARLYYCLFEFDAYKENMIDILKVWNGGLAIHGGLLAGLIYTIIYAKKYKINPIKLMDIIVPSLLLGQAIGRWGNFFNQEAYGPQVSLAFLKNLHIPKFIIEGMKIDEIYRHPTFLYESVVCFLTFIILFLIRKYNKKLKVGVMIGIYGIIYGIERFLVEVLRQDSLMLGNIKVAQLVSILMIFLGISCIVISCIKSIPYINTEVNNE